MKFLLDVNAGGTSAGLLIQHGHDVVEVSKKDPRMTDKEILSWALSVLCPLPSVLRPLSSTLRPLSPVFCLLSSVFYLLLSVFRLLSSALRLPFVCSQFHVERELYLSIGFTFYRFINIHI